MVWRVVVVPVTTITITITMPITTGVDIAIGGIRHRSNHRHAVRTIDSTNSSSRRWTWQDVAKRTSY